MTIELYAAPNADGSAAIDSPIANITGELPDQEPALNLGDLLGSFDSREEAIAFLNDQASTQNQTISDTTLEPFNPYTHVELLTVTLQSNNQSTLRKNYYLLTDEGY